MPKFPSFSSKKLIKILERSGAVFARQGSTDHAIYFRIVDGRRYSAPVQMGKKSLDPIYCKLILKQLKYSVEEINKLLK